VEYWYLFLLAGLVAGIVSSLFGVGAGIVMVPILALGFGLGQKSAQGTALMVMIPMVIVGAVRYKLNPNIEINMVVSGLMAVGGVVGAVIGSQLVFNISPVVLKRMFGIFIILAGINILLKTRKPPVSEPPATEQVSGEKPAGN
jgi:uncharacterized membrane protein YfcA